MFPSLAEKHKCLLSVKLSVENENLILRNKDRDEEIKIMSAIRLMSLKVELRYSGENATCILPIDVYFYVYVTFLRL